MSLSQILHALGNNDDRAAEGMRQQREFLHQRLCGAFDAICARHGWNLSRLARMPESEIIRYVAGEKIVLRQKEVAGAVASYLAERVA